MSRYSLHADKWRDCDLCPLCQTRTRVCIARGKVPADILIVAEAPGASEDVIGRPMVGPAGHLLDAILAEAWDGQWDYCITNLVGCIPLGEDGAKTAEPTLKSIQACAPRVVELLEICQPQLLVAVGKLAADWLPRIIPLDWMDRLKVCSITHPAAILRADISQKGLAIQRCVVTLQDAAEELVPF